MKAICVDDEPLIMQHIVSLCEDNPNLTAVTGFTSAQKALGWMEDNQANIALLDIDMPGMSGLELAMRIKNMQPECRIIFLTGYSEYAVDAFAMHASGYLLKPVERERLAQEIEFALNGISRADSSHIVVRTFGNFDIFVNDEPVSFSRSKAKEVLAYLVDRQGANVDRKNIFAALWEDGIYDRSMQKQLDVIIRSLRKNLEESGAGDILEMKRGMLRIVPEKFDCDLYRFIAGDAAAVNSYRGEYMSDYSWASVTEGYLGRDVF